MIDRIKEAIVNRLSELYPDITVYDEDLPADYPKPALLINVKSLNYTSLLQGNFKNQINFDITYYSNLSDTVKGDCLNIGQALLNGFSLSDYRLKNKRAETIDNVLHFTFELQYTVRKEEVSIKMQKQELNTNL